MNMVIYLFIYLFICLFIYFYSLIVSISTCCGTTWGRNNLFSSLILSKSCMQDFDKIRIVATIHVPKQWSHGGGGGAFKLT